MALTITYSDLYSAANVPAKSKGRPKARNTGDVDDHVEYTLPASILADTGSLAYLIPVQSGRKIVFLLFDCAALDAGTAIDADLVLRTTNAAGTHTDTIIYNAGTAFEAAHAAKFVWVNVDVPSDADSTGHIIFYVNTAATTPAAGAINLYAKVM